MTLRISNWNLLLLVVALGVIVYIAGATTDLETQPITKELHELLFLDSDDLAGDDGNLALDIDHVDYLSTYTTPTDTEDQSGYAGNVERISESAPTQTKTEERKAARSVRIRCTGTPKK